MLRSLAIVSSLTLAAFSFSTAALINVPGDYASIQGALDSDTVLDGDTVLVEPGIYFENLRFNGRNVIVASLFFMTGDRSYIGSTVIDGRSLRPAVVFSGGEDSRTALIGFTIQNGLAENGGGIVCLDSQPFISSNIIKNNIARGQGGGIFCRLATPDVVNNVITGNSAVQGGGLCYIDLNLAFAPTSQSGGNDSGEMGTRFHQRIIPDIDNNIIADNTAEEGGGIYCFNSNLHLENNTIAENSGVSGGGLYCLASHLEIESSIIWSNTADDDSHVFGDAVDIAYSDIQGGWPGDGNIDLDPLFRRPEYGDFRLMSIGCGDDLDSPCIDTGSPEFTDGLVECSRGRGTAFCDMGAYGGGGAEHSSAMLLRVPFDFDTLQQAINVSSDGDTVLVYPGVYPGNIDFGGRAITLTSMYAVNPVAEIVSSTVLDGQSSGPVVIFENEETDSACLTGLTLKNGRGVNGGGIYCHYSHPTIIGNIIESNIAMSDGGGIFCFYSDPVIEKNVLRSNQAISGAGILCRYSSPVIRGNRFSANQAQQEGGAILCRDNSLPIIEGNEIDDNSAVRGGGISCRYTAPSIGGNIIYSNESTSGGGLYCVGSSPRLANNIIAGNLAETGGGLSCLNSSPVIVNCILYFNIADEGGQISGDDAVVSFSDIQDGWDGIGNIDFDPLFRDFDGGDFHLSSSSCGDQFDSPCIDAGSPDISDSLLSCEWGLGSAVSDMGSHGGGNTLTGTEPPMVTQDYSFGVLGNFPNPFNSSTTISYRTPQAGNAAIEIYDICGRLVDVLRLYSPIPGEKTVIWDSGDLAAGVYFARLDHNRSSAAIKLVLVK